jgi:hypothetical protein
MRIFRTIVRALIVNVFSRQSKRSKCDVIRPEFIGHEPRWRPPVFLQQLPHQLQRRPGVPLRLHEKIQHLAFVINGTP